MQDEAKEFWRPTHARWLVGCAECTLREGIFIGALVMPTYVADFQLLRVVLHYFQVEETWGPNTHMKWTMFLDSKLVLHTRWSNRQVLAISAHKKLIFMNVL